MKTIFAVEDPEYGWVGFSTAEEAGTGATQINCYESWAEFNTVKLEKVREAALAKLTEVEKEALGVTNFKVAGITRTPAAVGAPPPPRAKRSLDGAPQAGHSETLFNLVVCLPGRRSDREPALEYGQEIALS